MEHPREDLETEAVFLDRISSTGFPSPSYLRNRGGELVFQEENHVAAVLPFLEGETPDVLSRDMISAMGSALAQLHIIDGSSLSPRTTWWHVEFLRSNLRRAVKRFGRDSLSRLESRILSLREFGSNELPVSIVHGDPWAGNALFDNQNLVALIDWEEATLGFSVFDLAYLAVHACFPNDKFDATLFESLIGSYEEIRKLSASERQHFGQVVQRIVCTNTLWHVLKSPGDHPDPGKLAFLDWYCNLELDKLSLDF